jgi:hypothetical protein
MIRSWACPDSNPCLEFQLRGLSSTDPVARRLHERKQVYLPARIDSQDTRRLGIMRDISRSGGRLFVNRSFQVGTDIRVVLSGGIERSCVVRRCVPIPGSQKFDIGFEVMEECWPENLLPSDDL